MKKGNCEDILFQKVFTVEEESNEEEIVDPIADLE